MKQRNTDIIKAIILVILNFFLALFICGVIAAAGLVAYYVKDAPQLTEAALTSTTSSKIYDKSNKLIADLGAEKRSNADMEEIPTSLVNAIVSIEDQRFFNHRGIDVIRIAGAFFNNVRRGGLQGGSTLDQQLIKLTYFSTSTKDQNMRRKIQEMWMALQLEMKNTKQEILTYYINKVYMSNGNYGMKTAANTYFGKDLKDLNLPQVALLAGMPQAPNQYDPYTHPDAAKARRDLVLREMYEEKYITKSDYEKAKATPVTKGLQPLKSDASYPAYMDNYLKQVIQEVEDKTGYNLLTTGMNVYTNVDSKAQKQLWDIYNTSDYVNYPDDSMQVASTVIDVHTGKVIAQLGGRHQSTNSSFGTNQAVETNRDFGSTMKPITDYAPAYEKGIYKSTNDQIADSPYNYPQTTIAVNNWDKKYFGQMSIQAALMYSRNVPAVKTLEAVGLEDALQFLNSIGIDYPEIHFSNAISSNTTQSSQKYGASSEKMAAAYAAFANGGTYYKPQYVRKVTFSDGTETSFKNEGTRVMTEETAFMMTSMLKTVLTTGTGTNANIPGVYQAGKTGTSNYSDDEFDKILQEHPEYNSYSIVAPDENYVGFTTKYAMAVWTGYSNRMTPVIDPSLNIATDVYREMISYLTPAGTSTDWTMPEGLYQSGSQYYLKGSQPVYTYSYSSSASSTSSSSSSSSSSHSQEKKEDTDDEDQPSSTPASSSEDNSSTSTDNSSSADSSSENEENSQDGEE